MSDEIKDEVKETQEEIPEAAQKEAEEDTPKKKRKKGWLIALIVILSLLVAAVAAAWIVYEHFFSLTNYVPDPGSVEISSDVLKSLDDESTIDPYEASRIEAELESIREAEEERQRIEASIREEQESLAMAEEEIRRLQSEAEEREKKRSGIVHIMLVGVDRRAANWNGNSDTMILLSLNRTKKTMTLTSFMRDSAANIPGIGVRKLNHAFAVGGGPLLLQTIQSNYQIPVENYAWIDFDSMVSVVNLLGGIDLYLTVAEAKYVGITIDSPKVVHLDGDKAVRHARDRSSGGNDYMRTQRQRNVLIALANKAKSGSLGDLARVAEQILPYITHNVDRVKLLGLLADFINIKEYTIQEQRIPFDGLYRSSNELLIPNYQETIARFWNFVE